MYERCTSRGIEQDLYYKCIRSTSVWGGPACRDHAYRFQINWNTIRFDRVHLGGHWLISFVSSWPPPPPPQSPLTEQVAEQEAPEWIGRMNKRKDWRLFSRHLATFGEQEATKHKSHNLLALPTSEYAYDRDAFHVRESIHVRNFLNGRDSFHVRESIHETLYRSLWNLSDRVCLPFFIKRNLWLRLSRSPLRFLFLKLLRSF